MCKKPSAMLANIREAHERNREWTRQNYSTALGIVSEGQSLTLQACELAREAMEQSIDYEFLRAFHGIAVRTIQTIETVIKTLEMGNYGSCFALMRAVLTDSDTCKYLAITDGAAKRWWELGQLYNPSIRSVKKTARKILEDEFRDSNIRQVIEGAEIPSSAAGYGLASEAHHTTAWGLMFYSKPDWDKFMNFQITPIPQHDPQWAQNILAILMGYSGDLCNVLLHRNEEKGIEYPNSEALFNDWKVYYFKRQDYLTQSFHPLMDVTNAVWRKDESVLKLIDQYMNSKQE